MRWMRFSIFLLVVTLLNAGNLLNTISVGSLNIRPDLLVILLVFFACSCPGFEAIIASFAIGFAADISGPVMGPAFLSFGLFGWLLRQLRKIPGAASRTGKAKTASIFAHGVVIFITFLSAGSLVQVLTLLKTPGLERTLAFFATREAMLNMSLGLVGTAIYSAGVGVLVWPVLIVISRWLTKRKT